jgi:toxin co-regulated pilus biosynthesis protein T
MINTNTTLVRLDQERRQYLAASVADAMRRKPSPVAFGEARDGPTIEEAVTVVTTGHHCISTMHPIGVSESARRDHGHQSGPVARPLAST